MEEPFLVILLDSRGFNLKNLLQKSLLFVNRNMLTYVCSAKEHKQHPSVSCLPQDIFLEHPERPSLTIAPFVNTSFQFDPPRNNMYHVLH